MAPIRLSIVDPLDRIFEVELPDDAPMNQLVPQLLPKLNINLQGSFVLEHKRIGKILRPTETLRSSGVQTGDVLRIVQLSTAATAVGVPGLDLKSVQDLQFEQLVSSPEALVMMVRQFERLNNDFKMQSVELETEKKRSADRFVATLLLLVSQVIFSIGTNLLTSNQVVPGLAVLAAGTVQASLAVYLSFRVRKT